MAPREFSFAERQALARKGHALPDGSYPMPDCDAVGRAVRAFGRAPDSHRAQLAALIRKRDAELGCNHDLAEIEET